MAHQTVAVTCRWCRLNMSMLNIICFVYVVFLGAQLDERLNLFSVFQYMHALMVQSPLEEVAVLCAEGACDLCICTPQPD